MQTERILLDRFSVTHCICHYAWVNNGVDNNHRRLVAVFNKGYRRLGLRLGFGLGLAVIPP